ncbi:hypothetical protein WMW71_11710 [Flavobacterium buctense]|uniref:Peptidase n=1 Tax=Flavobacterium buctense TaxID=1648146 RepID=A0ABU9E4Y9_9FLAO|nr:hypothetical protein [Flavobacterium buctense]
MEKKIIIRLVIFNFILASLITLDLFIPGKESSVKELDSFYSKLTHTGGNNNPTHELRHIVELSNGESYRIAQYPEKEYKKGQKLKTVKSIIFSNVNEIIVKDNNWEKIHVGLFSNGTIISLFVGSILVSLINLYARNKGLNIALIASTMFLVIILFLYITYY